MPDAPPVRDRRLFTILAIVFVNIVGAGMVLPTLPLFAKERFAISPVVNTLLVSSFFAAQFVAAPIGRARHAVSLPVATDDPAPASASATNRA